MRWKRSETEQNADDNEKLLISARAHLLTYLAELGKDGLLFVVDQQDRATFVRDFPRRPQRAGLAHLHFYGLRDTAAQPLAGWECGEMDGGARHSQPARTLSSKTRE